MLAKRRCRVKDLVYRLMQAAGRIAPAKLLAVAAAVLLSQLGMAQIGNELVNEFSAAICPVVRFLVGPLAWAAIAAGVVIGVIILALGGRGAVRWMLGAFFAAVILLVGMGYVRNNAGTFTQCFQ